MIKVRQFSEPPQLSLCCTDLLHSSPNVSSCTIPTGFSFWGKSPKKENSGKNCSPRHLSQFQGHSWCSSLTFSIHPERSSGSAISKVGLGGLLGSTTQTFIPEGYSYSSESRAAAQGHPMLRCDLMPCYGRGLPRGVQEDHLSSQVFHRLLLSKAALPWPAGQCQIAQPL